MKPFKWKPGTPPGVQALYFWQHGGGTSFNCEIFRLLGKSDVVNRAKIGAAWPELYQAWVDWHAHTNSDEFFEQFQEAR